MGFTGLGTGEVSGMMEVFSILTGVYTLSELNQIMYLIPLHFTLCKFHLNFKEYNNTVSNSFMYITVPVYDFQSRT